MISRRTFLVSLNLSAGALALGFFPRRARGDAPAPLSPNVFVRVDPGGKVTIVCHRSEMGQGVRSTWPVLIADEMGADMKQVVVEQALGDKMYGDQNTDGSSSIRKGYDTAVRAGATARTMLVKAAADRWKVNPSTCTARNHEVIHTPSGKRLPFSELVAAAAVMPVPKNVTPRPFDELTHVRSPSLPLLDGPGYVTGKAQFGADHGLAGMLIAVIARPPVAGGSVARFDAKRALAIPGVKRVIEMPAAKKPYKFQPWGGVAVLADNTWAAIRGRAALDITWNAGENGSYDSDTYRERLLSSVRSPGTTRRNVGDVDAAFAKAANVVEAEYLVPHLLHLPMEPPVAIAQVGSGTCQIWAPTQNPQAVRTDAAELLGWDQDKVTVHVTLLGGGFGRKSKADFVNEAVFLAREAGAPVRVQWTREDDIAHDYYNTVSAQRFRAGLDGSGKVIAWLQRTAFPPIANTFGESDRPSAGDLQQGVLDLVLDVPNLRAEACAASAHARIGWYRSVYNIFHAFASGSFIDELAHQRGVDPRQMWLEIIGPPRKWGLKELGVADLRNYGEPLDKHPVDAGRLRRVVERVTAASRFSEQRKQGRALGLAAHRSFVTYTAVVLSVVRDARRKIRVDEAWICMDAGRVVNQERAHAQMEGSVVMGISNALLGGVTMKNGVTEQSNFSDARIARIGDVPRAIHTDLVPGDGPPCGVGEPGVPPVGAALANAVFALTGQRIREIPIIKALT
jgi:isoquinoline 1-oxidoreductase subunit beta